MFSTLLLKDFIGIWFKIKIKTILDSPYFSFISPASDREHWFVLPKFVTFFHYWFQMMAFSFQKSINAPCSSTLDLIFFFLPPASSYEFNFNVIIFAILFLLQSISLYGLVDIFCTSAMHSSYIFVSSSQGHASHFPNLAGIACDGVSCPLLQSYARMLGRSCTFRWLLQFSLHVKVN